MNEEHMYIVVFGFCALLVPRIVCQGYKPQYSYNAGNVENIPNPAERFADCKMSGPSRICDLYNYFPASREGINNDLKKLEGLKPEDALGSAKECLCNKLCEKPTVKMVVLPLREIGPDLTDQRFEAQTMAIKLRDLWKLGNCSVIFFSSNVNDMSYSLAGSDVNELLTENKTKEIDERMHRTYAMNSSFEQAISQTVMLYSEAVRSASQYTCCGTGCIIGIIVGVLLAVGAVCGLVVYMHKRKNGRRQGGTRAEVAHLGTEKPPKSV